MKTASLAALALAAAAPAAAQCPSPDALEPNNSCQSAVLATLPFSVPALNVDFFDTDHFAVTIPAGMILDATISAPIGSASAAIGFLAHPACTDSAPGSTTATSSSAGAQVASCPNRSGAPLTVVALVSGPDFGCATYDLAFTLRPDPCQPPIADALEPNDDCASAFLLQPGVYSGLHCGIEGLDVDHYRVNVPVGHEVIVQVDLQSPSLYLEPQNFECGIPSHPLAFASRGIGSVNRTGSDYEVAFRVLSRNVLDGCGTYDLKVTSRPSPCASVPPDAFEPNQDCAGAAPVTPGRYTGLTLEGPSDPDWYSVRVEDGEQLTVDLTFDRQRSDITAGISWECILPQWTVVEPMPWGLRVIWVNDLTFGTDAHIQVAVPFSDILSCNRYDMEVHLGPPTSQCGLDALDGPYTCQTPLPISDGRYPGLVTEVWERDHYRVDVAPGAMLTVELAVAPNVPPAQPLRLGLFSPGNACAISGLADLAGGVNSPNGEIAAQWVNDTGQTQPVVISVRLSGDPAVCVRYDMLVLGSTSAGFVGSSFCPSNANGTLRRAIAFAEGSTSIAADDLTLEASLLTPLRTGFFVASRTTAPAIPVAQGNLCLAAPIVRLDAFVLQANLAGRVTLPVSYGSLPMPVLAGQSWSFQYWYRETTPMLGSNLSSGVTLQFQP